jgi:transposase InsO family protein
MIWNMRLMMDDRSLQTTEQIERFLEGNEEVEFRALSGEEKYAWIDSVLRRFRYEELGRRKKGIIRRYLGKVTGYSRAQVSRLIGQYHRDGELKRREYRRHRFAGKYTRMDMELLAKTDEFHDYLSGPATKKILEREYRIYGHPEFRNLSGISVAHLYNLRKRNGRLGLGKTFTKTKPSICRIGERAKPDPQGIPGQIRIDTVHQGDFEGLKGLYHINAVDEVTQWEVVASVERISEAYLVSILAAILSEFPFVIRGFHSDNGSEFVNYEVGAMLNRLLVRFTKSRPRHSNDNGLVESKNGAVIRKHLGYSHIPQRYAQQFNAYHVEFLNPYINFHRPCFFPVTVVDPRGKVKKKYPLEEVMTPYEKLKSLPGAQEYLAPGVTFARLDAIAGRMSDNEFAERMVKARSDLFERISKYDGRGL